MSQLILSELARELTWTLLTHQSLLVYPKIDMLYDFLYGFSNQCISPYHLILKVLFPSKNCNPFSAMSYHLKQWYHISIFISTIFYLIGCRDHWTRSNVIVCIINVFLYVTTVAGCGGSSKFKNPYTFSNAALPRPTSLIAITARTFTSWHDFTFELL